MIRHIRTVLMLAAALAINAHSVIPHDHHQETLIPSDHGSCPVHQSHHTNLPFHCHAFNDLVPEEKPAVVKTISFANFLAIINFHEDSSIGVLRSDYPDCKGMPETETRIPLLHSLRAPPSLG